MDELRAFERIYADALLSADPARVLAGAEGLSPELRAAVVHASPDGLRLTALLVAKLRFERLMNGLPRAIAWFDRDAAGFAAAFKRYHREVPPTARDPRAEHRLFEAWALADGARIRRLSVDDAAHVVPLRREALEEAPFSFGASPADDASGSIEHVRATLADVGNQAMFGCFDGAGLVGMAVMRREAGAKRGHRAGIFGVYVTPRARRQGVARALVAAAITQARAWGDVVQLELSVADAAPGAKRLYEELGFREWGRAPRALLHAGRYVDMFKLALDLGANPPPSPEEGRA